MTSAAASAATAAGGDADGDSDRAAHWESRGEPCGDPAQVVTENLLLGGRVRLRQPAAGYRAGIDPVLLAAAVRADPGESVLDVGSGAGAAAFCLAARIPGLRLTLIDADPAAAALARQNAALAPGISATVREADVAAPPADLPARSFDHVLTNPPFMPLRRGTPATTRGRAARQEGGVGLHAWIRACARWARLRGSVTAIHRADRCDELVAAMVAAGLGGISLLPLWPRAGVEAKRVIVRGSPGSRAPARLLPGLVLHRADGAFTEDAEAVLRDAATLNL